MTATYLPASYVAIVFCVVALLIAFAACGVLWVRGLDAASRILDVAWFVLLVAVCALLVSWLA